MTIVVGRADESSGSTLNVYFRSENECTAQGDTFGIEDYSMKFSLDERLDGDEDDFFDILPRCEDSCSIIESHGSRIELNINQEVGKSDDATNDAFWILSWNL